MAVYRYSERKIEELVNRSKKVAFWYGLTSLVILFAAILVSYYRPELLRQLGFWVLALLETLFLVPLARIIWNWRRRPQRYRETLQKTFVEVSKDTVRVSIGDGHDVQLGRSEIAQAEDASWSKGLYLRTSNRYRSLVIPSELDDLEAIKGELTNMGVPVVRTRFRTNWEEFVGMCAFAGTMLCSVLARDPRTLTLNLVVAACVATGAVYIVRSNPDAAGIQTKTTLGAFIPVVVAAGALWISVHAR